jgi:lysophospholipase L1-like esterase
MLKSRSIAIAAAAFTFAACGKPEPDLLRQPEASKSAPDASPPDASPLPPDAAAHRPQPAYVASALRNPRIVLLGDSIVHYSGELVSRRLQEAIRSAGHPDATVTGVTKGGQRVDGWIGRQFGKYVKDPGNNVIVLEGGVNDIGWYGKVGHARIRADAFGRMLSMLGGMVDTAREHGKVLVLVSVSPWKGQITWDAAGQDYTGELNRWMKDQSSKDGVFFADTYAVLGSACDPDALSRGYRGVDVQHPNDAGKKLIGETIAASMGYPVPVFTPPASPENCGRR